MTTTPESTGLPSNCNDFSTSSDGNDTMDASQCPLPSELTNGPAVPNAAAGSSIGAAGPRDDGRQQNTVYYRRQVSPKRLHAERVSRPRYTVLIRPLNKVHVTDIPKQALTDAIEQSAPSAFIAEMAILRFDTTSNCIRITVRDEGHFRKLCTLSRLLATVNGNLRVFDVDTSSLQAHVAGSSRGVIKIRAGLTIEYIKAHLRCEQATITDVRMLGKTQLLLLTFDTERIPQRLVFEYEVIQPLPTKQVSWAQVAASSDLSQLIASLRQEIQELRKENQRLRDLVMTPKKGNRSLTPRRSRSRNERKSRSPTRRVKPVTDKDSAYSHVIGLLRQERAQESNKLEQAIRSDMVNTLTQALDAMQTRFQNMFDELQRNETRGPCSLPGYRAFQTPTIKHKRQIPKGQAALLVRNDCPATQPDLPGLCSKNREIIAAKICPPGQKPFVAASAYFRPGNTSVEPYTWLETLKQTAQNLPLLIGGDFNAHHPAWSASRPNQRGRYLYEAIELSSVEICNTPDTPTRIGLHKSQKDTTPDLTLASPNFVRHWIAHSQSWGSDHLPIFLTINRKRLRRLGRVPGLQGLWRIFRSLSGKGRGNSPLTELFTKADPATVEEEIITTFFPHASLTPPVPPNTCAIPEPDPDLYRPFSMGEMLAAIKSGLPPLQDVIREAHTRHHIRMENTPQGRRLLAWDGQQHDDAPPLNMSLPPWETPIASRRIRRPISRNNVPARQLLATRQLKEASSDTIDIYTDAAISKDRAYMAWVCTQTTAHSGAYSCHLPSGTPAHAELLAIWGATASLPYTIRKPVRVYTDSHTAYSEIFRPASEDAAASAIQAILRRHEKANSPIEIIWTPGHTGVPGGNTAAHAAAASAGNAEVQQTKRRSTKPSFPAEKEKAARDVTTHSKQGILDPRKQDTARITATLSGAGAELSLDVGTSGA
ncbi:hypothetical protein HPB49_007781 [Dermacentor silvarum]|uniref:Uncharacterized protein n=1 Tax=Dermacentor silvarum TaxID=543639 RepID=A0ACB8DXK9_DERSI|nr:hypothetical protein HPB49_007781 [Dermacentor silvarum]